jgi:ADP-ribose pyrophosphatase YjhB (NUDIX family)
MWESRAGAGTLVVRDGRVLMILRERSGKLRWELPSGLLEHGESFEEAAARETHEETSIQVEVGHLLCTVVMDVPNENYTAINVYFCAFAEDKNTPRPQSLNEPVRRADFIDTSRLRPSDIHPVDRRILTRWSRKPDRKPFHFRILL